MHRQLSIAGLSKRYTIQHRLAEGDGFRHMVQDLVTKPFRRLRSGRATPLPPREEDLWALRDVSFDVMQGEVLGIIGRNGAGKSTLLKVLSRITEPTEGQVVIRGRVASLLEVGTGFHPELTGRENIFVNGAILGMTRRDIRARFDEIVAFAEIERFLDTPVKRYSSGMYVRLAFAVAAHLEPEILIVDEVLAVGDAQFQNKCLGKMKDVASGEGRTVLFVSHNLAAVQALCTGALHLQGGRLIEKGSVEAAIASYAQEVYQAQTSATVRRRLSDTVTLDGLAFTPNPVRTGEPVAFAIDLSSTEPCVLKELAVLVYSRTGTRVAMADLRSTRLDYGLGPGRPLAIRGRVGRMPLIEGTYIIGIYINCGDAFGNFFDLCELTVTASDAPVDVAPYPAHERGLVDLAHEFTVA